MKITRTSLTVSLGLVSSFSSSAASSRASKAQRTTPGSCWLWQSVETGYIYIGFWQVISVCWMIILYVSYMHGDVRLVKMNQDVFEYLDDMSELVKSVIRVARFPNVMMHVPRFTLWIAGEHYISHPLSYLDSFYYLPLHGYMYILCSLRHSYAKKYLSGSV